MQTILIIVGAVIAVVAALLILVAIWMKKQNLLGFWIAALPDGTYVTLQFEGAQKGGIYKQLTTRDAVEVREFGHWAINIGELRLIIMASDTEDHPRFGVDTQYWVTWEGKDRMIIDGPDRPKWALTRGKEGLRIDFDAGSIGEQGAAPNGDPAAAVDNSSDVEGRHR